MTQAITMWGLAVYYGLYVLFAILKECFMLGFTTVFRSSPMQKPEILVDPVYGKHDLLTLEGMTIHYVISGPTDKPLMLLVHGFPEFWFSWRHQIREFQKDYRVVAIDQRGFGDSKKPKGIGQYTGAKLLSDLQQIIKKLGYKKCILVAHDWGGVVAWAFGRYFNEMVDKLIIMNAPPGAVFKELLYSNKQQLKMSWYMFFFQLPYLPEVAMKTNNFNFLDNLFANRPNAGMGFARTMENPLSKEEIDAYKYTYSQPGALTPPINYYRASFQGTEKCASYDLNYTMPVLLIWGAMDALLSCEIPEEAKKMSPNIDVKLVPEAGHFVQMDAPEMVNRIMREWLEK